MFVTYPAIFYKDIDSKGYVVVFPDFEEGATQGEDENDAMCSAQDWLGCVLYDYFVEQKEFPKASSIEEISIVDKDYWNANKSFKTLVGLDIIDYVKKVDKKTVRKTLTIPSYLNEMAKSRGINFSQLLQDALKQEFDIED